MIYRIFGVAFGDLGVWAKVSEVHCFIPFSEKGDSGFWFSYYLTVRFTQLMYLTFSLKLCSCDNSYKCACAATTFVVIDNAIGKLFLVLGGAKVVRAGCWRWV